MTAAQDWTVALNDAEAQLPAGPDALRFGFVLRHAGMSAGLYAPGEIDRQSPHPQPELYIVARGSGTVVKAGQKRAIAKGDAILVEAEVEHRFEDASGDLLLWVIFWTPPKPATGDVGTG